MIWLPVESDSEIITQVYFNRSELFIIFFFIVRTQIGTK